MELNIKYLNLICTDLGGVGGHTLNVKAENEICTLLGGVGGHTLELKAINEIYSLVFGSGTFKTNLSALNAILAASGEQPEITEVRAWKKIQEGTNLNLLKKAIDDWQADATLVQVSGLPVEQWTNGQYFPWVNYQSNTFAPLTAFI